MFQKAITEQFPTFEKMMRHKVVVAFVCGLLPDPSLVVEHFYTLYIYQILYSDRFCTYEILWIAMFLESLYRESLIKLNGYELNNKYINIKDDSEDMIFKTKLPSGPLHWPSRVFVFCHIEFDTLSSRIKTQDKTIMDSAIIICKMEGDNLARLALQCCEISQEQPIAHIFLKDCAFPILQDWCHLKFSRNFLQLQVHNVSMQSEAINHTMKQISESAVTQRIDLQHTSLPKVKSINLMNKNKSLLHFSLLSVTMDADLCESLLEQVAFLTNLKFLRIGIDDAYGFEIIDGTYCRIPRALCAETLGSISHLPNLIHLDISTNDLRGCLSHFISDSHPGLPFLERLNLRFTNLKPVDINHLTNLMTTNKLPTLTHLFLRLGRFYADMDILIKAAIAHHQRRLNLVLTTYDVEHPWGFYQIENLEGHLQNKWSGICEGTHVKLHFLYEGDIDREVDDYNYVDDDDDDDDD